MPAPLPSENLHWPAWFYPPGTEEATAETLGRVFQQAEDVPEGWLHHWSMHGTNLNREPPAAPTPRLTRSELRRELDKRDIAYPPNAAVAELQKLLDEALAEEAQDQEV